jgi:hypothetical protein
VVWAPTIDLPAIRSRWRGLPFVHVCATALSLTPLDLVVWGKASAGAGNLYRAQHELLPLFKSEINNDPRLPLLTAQSRRAEGWPGCPRPSGSTDIAKSVSVLDL